MAARHDPQLIRKVMGWMAATGRGYKAAAKEFGLSPDTVKSWGKAARGGDSGGEAETIWAERAEEGRRGPEADAPRGEEDTPDDLSTPTEPRARARAPARDTPRLEIPHPDDVVHHPTLSPDQSLAVHLLLAGHPERDVCAAMAIPAARLRLWRADPAFIVVYEAGVRALLDRSRKDWAPKALDVLDTLRELALNTAVDGKVRVAAANGYLDRVGFPKAERLEIGEPVEAKTDLTEAELDRRIAAGAALLAEERGEVEAAGTLRRIAG